MSERKAKAARAKQRQTIATTEGPPTVEELARGFAGPGPYVLRMAGPGDGQAVVRLTEMAGTEPLPFLGQAIEDQAAGGYTVQSCSSRGKGAPPSSRTWPTGVPRESTPSARPSWWPSTPTTPNQSGRASSARRATSCTNSRSTERSPRKC